MMVQFIFMTIAFVIMLIVAIIQNSKIKRLEKQGEQKPVDKVEPKFKVGDRIKFKGIHNEDVIRVITNIQKGEDGGFRYFFADGSIHSIGDDEIELVGEPVSEEFISKPFNVEIDSSRSDGRVILSGNFFEFNTGDKARIVFVKSDI